MRSCSASTRKRRFRPWNGLSLFFRFDQDSSARQTHDYRRAGVTSLYAAIEVASGKVIGQCRSKANGGEVLQFLKTVASRFRRKERENPTPFVWTKEPADIIKKALRRAR